MKRKKRISLIGALALAALVLGSCGAETAEAPESPADTSAVVQEAPLEPRTSFLTEEAYTQADMWPVCDDSALAAVMRKAQAGEDVTIAVIGGSITEGVIAAGGRDGEVTGAKPYADYFFSWWEERFPEVHVERINAGIGGTDSYLGVHRLQAQVLDKDPDLVLVEFSVNDGADNAHKKSYENLIRDILLSGSGGGSGTEGESGSGDSASGDGAAAPAVMLLFMAQTNGATAQGTHVLVGHHYALPMVSYANAMKTLTENGDFTAQQLAGDGVHPSAVGHAIVGEILWRYLNDVYTRAEELTELPAVPEALTKQVYRHALVIDSTNPEGSGELYARVEDLGSFTEGSGGYQYSHFTKGWKCAEGAGEIRFTASFRNLGILYMKQIGGNPGRFEVLVDGEALRTLDASNKGGWGNAFTSVEVYTSTETAEHQVVIRKAEDSEGNEFGLLGLLLSED
ncbi:MAG: hypothetical protein IKS07_05050 [Lachnospiraceae bacterium]|nr:hypothetical protein [Lachnospiraceae bacterium]